MEPQLRGSQGLITFTSQAERDAAEAAASLAQGQIYRRFENGSVAEAGFVASDGSFVNTGGQVWQTLTTLDLTSFTTTDFVALGDGAHTVDGVVFNVLNTANASTFALNANGLVIAPNVFNGLTTSKWDAPVCSFDLSVLLGSDFDAFALFSAQLGLTTTMATPTNGSQILQLGFWNGQPNPNQQWMCIRTGMATGGVDFTQHRIGTTSSASDFPALGPAGPRGHLELIIQNAYTRSREAASFSAFSPADTLTAIGEGDYPSTQNAQAIGSPHVGDFYNTGRQRLYIGAIRSGGTTEAWELRATDLRVQKFA